MLTFADQFDHLPIIPDEVLRHHGVHHPIDTRFRSAARLLQALWRVDRQLPSGTFIKADGKPTKLGSRIMPAAARAGQNFLSPAIAALVHREVCYREIGAMIDEERLFTNLLSSMPLVFNLFGPLKLDLELATRVFAKLLPNFAGTVTQVLFEHSPARSDPRFTDDRTAFDVVIRYRTAQGARGFIAIEVKYSESCTEPVPPAKPSYVELSRDTGLFIDADAPRLRANPMQQFWREHCLAQSMIRNDLYDEGKFILVAPQLNHLVQNAASAYACELKEPSDKHVAFINLHLESLVEAVGQVGAGELAQALHRRYCDFWLVDGEIELFLADLPNRTAKSKDPSRSSSGAGPNVTTTVARRPRHKPTTEVIV